MRKLKEWKEKFLKKSKKWEINGYMMMIYKDKVSIQKNNYGEFKAFLFCFYIPFVVITLTILIMLIESIENNINHLIFFIIYLSFILPFYILGIVGWYDLYWNRGTEWIIDTINQNIIFSRIKPTFKNLKKIDFSDVEYLLYEGGQIDYILGFHINRFKNPVFFGGKEYVCRLLGIVLAKYMNKPLYYRNNRFSRRFLIYQNNISQFSFKHKFHL